MNLSELTRRTAITAEILHLTHSRDEIAALNALQDLGLVTDEAVLLGDCFLGDLEGAYKKLAGK